MDADLRAALRGYQRGEVSQSAALAAVARAGITRQSHVVPIDAALKRAFLEDLDVYESVERELLDLNRDVGLRDVRGTANSEDLFVWITRSPRLNVVHDWYPPVHTEAAVLSAENGLLRRFMTAGAQWHPIAAEDLDLDVEVLIADELADVWIARRRLGPEVVKVAVWYPSRLDVLERGDASDVRVSVSAPLRDRLDAIEAVCEALPGATVVSSQVAGGKRPARRPGPQSAEALWPEESKRVHVR